MRVFLGRLLELLASYGLATLLFVYLLILTYLGTLDQVEHGLYHAQATYFHSFLAMPRPWGVPVLMPGAYPVLMLLCVNIFLGVATRICRGWAQAGMLLMHGGVLVLMAGAFVGFHMGIYGEVRLREGEVASYITLNEGWEFVASRDTGARQEIVFSLPEGLEGLGPDVAASNQAPFVVEAFEFLGNAIPTQDGTGLEALPMEHDPARNEAGLRLTLRFPDEAVTRAMDLWSGNDQGSEVIVAGEAWRFRVRRARLPMPFALRLDHFQREVHPGTNEPRHFSSEVTCIESGVEQRAVIRMNEPLRHSGYTFFQASWGPQQAMPGVPLYTVLAVARNPAERFPLYACAIIALGMGVHFLQRLWAYQSREKGRA